MKRTLLLALLFLSGCRSGTTPPPQAAPKKQSNPDDEKVLVAVEMFRPGAETGQLRDALQMISPVLGRPENLARLSLKPQEKTFLEAEGKLTAAEFQELESPDYRPLDAIYAAGATLFRDAARSLQVTGLGDVEQAELAFDWATRRVLLYEQGLDALPPAFTLRAGHGSATDRGIVFLALMRQFQREGALIAEPGATSAPLVGIAIGKKLYLFDTRLGRPVPGPGGKGIATWDEVVKQPELLKDSKIAADKVGTLQAYVVAPLESLSGRMRYLESLLAGDEAHVGGERLTVALDAGRIAEELRGAGVNRVGIWTPALRAERMLAPPSDGGLDKQAKLLRFNLSLIPAVPVVRRFQQWNIDGELPTKARQKLREVTLQLFEKYDLQPSEMLVRGQYEALARRMERGRNAIEDADFSQGRDDASLRKLAAQWRERVNEAYLAEVRNEPDGPAKVNAIWNEDEYLLFLLNPEIEAVPRALAKKTLSRLVLGAVLEQLSARTNWISASLSQDKAERTQASWNSQKDAGRTSKTAPGNARNAWLNARSAWTKYLDRNNIGPTALAAALPEIRAHFQRGDGERALSMWEDLQRDIHRYAAARLELAHDMAQTGQDPAASLDALAAEIEQLLKDPAIAKERSAVNAGVLQNVFDGPARWSLVERDWGPEGNLAWLLESIRLARGSEKS